MFRLSMLLTVAAIAAAPPPSADRFTVLPEGGGGGIRVRVAKRGLFAAFAHDHDFEVTRWRGRAVVPGGDPARASLELVLEADSLRDREKGLSGEDRAHVDAQAAGPEVLDAAHAPEITFRSERVSVDPSGAGAARVRGTLHGTLTLRGRTRPVDARFEAVRVGDAWRVRGKAPFRQSQFGIKPFSGFGGTVGVKDEVEVAFALTLRPGAGAAQAAGPSDAGGAR